MSLRQISTVAGCHCAIELLCYLGAIVIEEPLQYHCDAAVIWGAITIALQLPLASEDNKYEL